MKVTEFYHLLHTKIHKTQEFYTKYGFWKTIVNFFENRKIILKRKLIFYETLLEEQAFNDSKSSLEFVELSQEELEHPDTFDNIFTRERALQRFAKKECRFVALKNKGKIVCRLRLEFKKVDLWFFDMWVLIPDDVVYLSDVYTLPEYRGKGIAPQICMHALQYFKNHGYRKSFIVIAPDNFPSQKVGQKLGFKEYQTVIYRRFLVLKYYRVKDYHRDQTEIFWSTSGTDQKIWNAFSRLGQS